MLGKKLIVGNTCTALRDIFAYSHLELKQATVICSEGYNFCCCIRNNEFVVNLNQLLKIYIHSQNTMFVFKYFSMLSFLR